MILPRQVRSGAKGSGVAVEAGVYIKIPQTGRVLIGDEPEAMEEVKREDDQVS